MTTGALAVGGLLVITATPAGAATPCASDCITNTDVAGTPEGAVFTFDTTGLTRALIVASDANETKPYVVKKDDTWGSSYQVSLDDPNRFAPATVYHYDIYATDTAGDTWRHSGQFVTSWRTASVHYSNLHVINDGDTIGAGDFVGDGRCGEGTTWTPLAPLVDDQLVASWDDKAVELNDGESHWLDAGYSCPMPVGKTIDAQTAVADDDTHAFTVDPNYFHPDSPSTLEEWNMVNFDQAYATVSVSDPLDPATAGSASVPIDMVSPVHGTTGEVPRVRYEVTGTATFTHTTPMVTLAKSTSGPGLLSAHAAQGTSADEAVLIWSPKAFHLITGSTATRVFWKEAAKTTWQSEDVLDPNVGDYQFTNLKLGTYYDMAVARVMPGGLLALRSQTLYLTPGNPLKPTTITGWSTAKVTAPLGTTVTSTVQVSTDGTPRSVKLQYQKVGTSTWTTASQVGVDATGHATLSYKVAVGYRKWRVYAPWTDSYDEATTATRILAPKTVIAGFNATAVTAVSGTKINDGIVVTPGAKRLAYLWYQKSGSTTWVLAATLTTDASGALTLPEVARKGTYVWNVVVPFNVYQGEAAWTVNRTIKGT